MNISVIGAGYVGLTTAACLAEIGHHVTCGEVDVDKLTSLQNGNLPFFEPLLETIVARNRATGRLQFSDTEAAIDRGHAIFICVGTPPLHNGEADLSAIEAVARTIAKQAKGYRLIIEKSTVPVQTGRQLRRYLDLHSVNGLRYDVVSNPEFLREGSAIEDFFHPDRIVIGVENDTAAQQMQEIYNPLLQNKATCPVHPGCNGNETRFIVTDTNSAELIKHASNSFLAMKISFINIVADLCEAAGADVRQVAEAVGLDSRIGSSFLQPGIGFGGFCFPKDLQAFVRIAEKFGCDFNLLREVERVNQTRVDKFVEKLRKELWVIRGKTICVWGLAFKPNTDDIRFAPAMAIVRRLQAEGARIRAYDPQAMGKAERELPEVRYCDDLYEAATGADVVVLLTQWKEFRRVDWERLHAIMERPLIIDGRNALDVEEVTSNNFHYVGIGGLCRSAQAQTSLSANQLEAAAL